MVCKIRLGRGALMRGKTPQNRWVVEYGGLYFFQALSMPSGWEVLQPWGLCTGGKVRDISDIFPKGMTCARNPRRDLHPR
jgi:hypothetical protein